MMCVAIGGGYLCMFLADLVRVLPEVWDLYQKIWYLLNQHFIRIFMFIKLHIIYEHKMVVKA